MVPNARKCNDLWDFICWPLSVVGEHSMGSSPMSLDGTEWKYPYHKSHLRWLNENTFIPPGRFPSPRSSLEGSRMSGKSALISVFPLLFVRHPVIQKSDQVFWRWKKVESLSIDNIPHQRGTNSYYNAKKNIVYETTAVKTLSHSLHCEAASIPIDRIRVVKLKILENHKMSSEIRWLGILSIKCC